MHVLATAHDPKVREKVERYRPLAALHQEAEVLLRKVGEQVQVQRRAHVVAGGHKHVLVTLRQQGVQSATPGERREHAAVARLAPLKFAVYTWFRG